MSIMVAINPGTGPIGGSTEAHAEANIRAFIDDLLRPGTTWRNAPSLDYGEGRFCFILTGDSGRDVEVQMPGIPLEEVRYMGKASSSPTSTK